ncbi:hypothetical protein EN817_03320 [Mesorhizobium sp. M3A.F.Ca.ET.174.01.1.1]|uniref:hypothetical protein n=1 Tax=unclassified Mesorhizobium TaxID=325217 RepID=UPI001093BB31|nr:MULTISPECIES: hypothetical protein [unclassified Mesorhizobium]TGS89390.1 hypothetical protein EN818_03320 [Mesorhizobium sp. M3A.F.Ca.ET.175.01.1.1]TGT31163.1 hypothetical protein EN817_03320 [Mesorhizobium sp. M3A.F.Ca.ET.174.01.1.1]
MVMFKILVVTFATMIVASQSFAQSVDDRRKLYALGEAGPEYCPNIETGWFKMGAIGYDMSADEGEYQRYKAAKNQWFQTFRNVGSQPVVCQFLMDKFGPGTVLELFQYR